MKLSEYIKLMENDMNKEIEIPHISKEDEHRAVDFIKKAFGKKYTGIGKNLKKIKHIVSSTPFNSDEIDYESSVNGRRITFYIRWFDDLVVAMKWNNNWFRENSWVHIDQPNAEEMIPEGDENRMPPNLITKEEEGRGLDLIRKRLVSRAVKAYNLAIQFKAYNSAIQFGHLDSLLGAKPVDEKEVRMNLKKISRTKHDPKALNKSQVDIIQYISKINNGKFPMLFHIVKSPGSLRVEWSHQHDSYGSNYVAFVYSDQPIENGVVMVESVTPGGDEYEINKDEERYAYIYFLRQLLPQMLEDTYLKPIRKHPTMYSERRYPRQLTVQDISRTTIKKRRDRDNISYESIINDYVGFAFFLKKMILNLPNGTKKVAMSMGCQGPINNDWKWYSIKGL